MLDEKCVFAGSFDPVTAGHIDVIGKCAMMFSRVVVAIGVNAEKKYTFSLKERLEMLKAACRKYECVEVKSFDGYLVDFLKAENAVYYARGIRDARDEEYESKAFRFNSDLFPEIETVFIPCSKETKNVSSSLVKELLKGGKPCEKYIPYEARELFESFSAAKLSKKKNG